MKNLKLSLFVKADKINETGEVPVFLKIIKRDSRTTLRLGLKVDQSRWKETNQFKNTRVLKEVKIRVLLGDAMSDIRKIYQGMKLKEIPFSAVHIKNEYLDYDGSEVSNKLMLSELFDKHYKSFIPLIQSSLNRQKIQDNALMP